MADGEDGLTGVFAYRPGPALLSSVADHESGERGSQWGMTDDGHDGESRAFRSRQFTVHRYCGRQRVGNTAQLLLLCMYYYLLVPKY